METYKVLLVLSSKLYCLILKCESAANTMLLQGWAATACSLIPSQLLVTEPSSADYRVTKYTRSQLCNNSDQSRLLHVHVQ